MATTARRRTPASSTRRAKATPISAGVSRGSAPRGRILRNAQMARRVADALLDAAGYDPRRVAVALRTAEDTLNAHPELLDAIRMQAPDAEPVDVMLALARQAMAAAAAEATRSEAVADGEHATGAGACRA